MFFNEWMREMIAGIWDNSVLKLLILNYSIFIIWSDLANSSVFHIYIGIRKIT